MFILYRFVIYWQLVFLCSLIIYCRKCWSISSKQWRTRHPSSPVLSTMLVGGGWYWTAGRSKMICPSQIRFVKFFGIVIISGAGVFCSWVWDEFLGQTVMDSCWPCRVLGKSLQRTSVLIFAIRMLVTCRTIICTVSQFPTRLKVALVRFSHYVTAWY